jgi:hypothetical protein
MVEEALHRLAVLQVRGNDLHRILRLHVSVKDAIRFNNNVRSLLTETVTAGKIDHGIPQSQATHLGFKSLVNGVAATGDTPGSPAHINRPTEFHGYFSFLLNKLVTFLGFICP